MVMVQQENVFAPHVYTTVRVSSKQSNIFFGSNRNKPKLNLFRLFSVCFAKPKNLFFGLFRCYGLVSKQPKQTEFSRKQTKTNRKNLPKTFSNRGFSKPLIFFSRFKPKLNLFRLFFGLLFEKPKKIFSVCFDFSDRYRNNRNNQNL